MLLEFTNSDNEQAAQCCLLHIKQYSTVGGPVNSQVDHCLPHSQQRPLFTRSSFKLERGSRAQDWSAVNVSARTESCWSLRELSHLSYDSDTALNLLAWPCSWVLHRGRAVALSSLLLQDLPDEVCAAGAHMATAWLACPEEQEGGHLQASTRGCEKVGCRGPCSTLSHSKCCTTSLRHSSLCDTQLGTGPCCKPACCTI